MPDHNINPRLDAIQFINESVTTNTLTGRLLIGHDRHRWDISGYELHWGRDAQSQIGANSLIAAYGAENTGESGRSNYVFQRPLMHTFAETPLPHNAAYFLVFATDHQGQKFLYAAQKLVNETHLLPPSATRFERRLAATSGRLSRLPVAIDSLWDPSRCRPELLPWLAWAASVDIWFDNKDDPTEEASRRRELIRKSAFVHQHKGTRAAIRQALNAFANANITLTEWWQQTPPGPPHTFNLDLLVNGNLSGIAGADLNERLRQAIDAIKPVRSHYTFTISTVQTSTLRLAASSEAVSYKRFNMAAAF
jgi:phage tail P2-like protein